MTNAMNWMANVNWTVLWLPALLVVVFIRLVTWKKIRLEVFFGTVTWGSGLVFARIYRAITERREDRKIYSKPKKRLEKANQVIDYLSIFPNLKPMEVVMCQGPNLTKIDFGQKVHTLIAGKTQYGKTRFLNSILIQLFGKGKKFTDVAEVYLLDLKGNEDDYLELWKPLCTRYYSITRDDQGVIGAIELIKGLMRRLHMGKKGKHVIFIIDELAALTSHVSDGPIKKTALAALLELAQKSGGRASVIIVTQYTVYDTIPRSISTQLGRKITFAQDDDSAIRLALRFDGMLPTGIQRPDEPGEFLLRDPKIKGTRFGRTMDVSLPAEPENVIMQQLEERGESDSRMKFAAEVLVPREGDRVQGVNARYKAARKANSATMSQDMMTTHYRNYSNAGALDRPDPGQPFRMMVDRATGLEMIRAYITAGGWESAPKVIAAKENKKK